MSNKTKIFVMSSANYIISALFNTLTSVLAAYFAGDVGMSAGMMGIFFSMGGVLTAVAMTLPGRFVDKVGAKKGMIITCIAQLVAFALFPVANSAIVLMVLVSINSLATALCTPCNTQVLRALDVKDPAKMLRVNMISSSLGGMVCSALAARLIENGGMTWRASFWVFFAISLVVGVIGMLVIAKVDVDFTGIKTVKEKDASAEAAAKSYKFTKSETTSCVALCLLYIGYMGVGISLSMWLPALLAGKGFDGVSASMPTTVATVVQLLCYFFLPTIAAKALRTTKITPVVAAVNILCVFGMLLSGNIGIVVVARAVLAITMSFLSMHVQSDMARVAPRLAAGRYSSIILASANAGGVVAVVLLGFLTSMTAQVTMLVLFAVIGVVGAAMFIKPDQSITAERA